jgi:hypothetical protein
MTDELHLVRIAGAARARSTRFDPKPEETIFRARIVRPVSVSGQLDFCGPGTWMNYQLRKERATVLLPRRLMMPLPVSLSWARCADGSWQRRNGLWRKD